MKLYSLIWLLLILLRFLINSKRKAKVSDWKQQILANMRQNVTVSRSATMFHVNLIVQGLFAFKSTRSFAPKGMDLSI